MAITGHLRTDLLRDYITLAKPWGIIPHFITATSAMFLAANDLPRVDILVCTLVGGGLVAASGNVFNCYLDRDIDCLMERTRHRPLPAGRLKPFQALIFGSFLGSAGLLILSLLVNRLAALLAAITLIYYILPYTLWLKRRTQWSPVIGSGAGAIPPLIGWAAVTGRLAVIPFLLFAIVLLWTLPHFWSLAIFRRDDYEMAGLHVIPSGEAIHWIRACSALLVLTTLVLMPVAHLGWLYLSVALFLGVGFIAMAVRLKGEAFAAVRLYSFSIIYIAILFGAIIIDRLIYSL